MPKTPLTKSKAGSRTVSVTPAAPAMPATPVTATSSSRVPTHEEIARRAYEIYVARGQTCGHELEDWIQAERELLAKAHRNN